jgi:hypothetical protein
LVVAADESQRRKGVVAGAKNNSKKRPLRIAIDLFDRKNLNSVS